MRYYSETVLVKYHCSTITHQTKETISTHAGSDLFKPSPNGLSGMPYGQDLPAHRARK